MADNQKAVGVSVPRIEAREKVLGRSVYVDDLRREGMIWGKVVRSPHPRARIVHVDVTEARGLPGVVAVLTAADVPGDRYVGPLVKDQPILCSSSVRFEGDAVALVAATAEEVAETARDAVRVEYEILEPVLDPIAAMSPEAPQVQAGGNVASYSKLRRGDVEVGFRAADVIVEDSFSTQMIDHAYLEPEGAVAEVDAEGKVTIWVCSQYPHYDRQEVARVLGVSLARVRVIQTTTGGGFGGKFGSPLVSCYAALLAARTGRPAKVLYTREESLRTTVKRHPYRIHYKVGATRSGKLTAVEARFVGDTGAYLVVGRAVVGKSTSHGAGPYEVPHVKMDGYAVYTNKAPAGAMRGYGVPQVAVAYESLLDELARKLNLDPIEFRLKNVLREGSQTATGQTLLHSVGVAETLERAADARREMTPHLKTGKPYLKRGIGVGVSWHGIGAARSPSQATAYVNLCGDGSATVLCGSVDIGQGSNTLFSQIAAEELGVPLDQISVVTGDTLTTPDCEATTATRVTYLSGNAVRLAAEKAKGTALELAAKHFGCLPEHLILARGKVQVPDAALEISLTDLFKKHAVQQISALGVFSPDCTPLDPETGQGSPHATYGFGTHVALVEVDQETGAVRLVDYAAFNDVGKAINPQAVEGQIEGAVAMGTGYALSEGMIFDRGKILNPSFATYLLLTAADLPPVRVGLVEAPEPTGPYGAKGVGEPSMNPVAAAVINAIYDAVGVRIRELPAVPETVFAALKTRQPLPADR
ncbi:MAG: xanthine dehydrogenase family protein [Acidobacteria bacterium]|nr:xanthine dehydrogenase family protein [Acidobacteriota bacterium]